MQLPILRAPGASPAFDDAVRRTMPGGLVRSATTTLQINVGRRCNQACLHCHVEAGPSRTEEMSDATMSRVLTLLERSRSIRVVDITGGAPELHPRFRALVTSASDRGYEVIDRCNLTILLEPGMEGLAEFLAERRVQIVASLPCYLEANVDRQRGRGVFESSVRALRALNALGYGMPGSELSLSLVYNPSGASLPPSQVALEQDYRRELRARHGVEFHRLFTLANMPIRRFEHSLARDGVRTSYEAMLASSFNPATLDALMCRSLVSVAWDGGVHDCDFNQMLDIPAGAFAGTSRRTVDDLESFDELDARPIATAAHCFGCTAGAGSSCGGALSA